jgi:hypothetical protein
LAGNLRPTAGPASTDAAPPELDPPLRQLLAAWRALCRGAAMPRRERIDVAAFAVELQPFLALVDIAEGGSKLRFRYCGAKLAEAAGMDLTGHLVHRLNPDRPYAAYIEALYDRAQSTQRPVYSECSYTAQRSAATRFTQRLICPLASGGGQVVSFIAAQTYCDSIDRDGESAAPAERPSFVYHDHFVPGRVVVL